MFQVKTVNLHIIRTAVILMIIIIALMIVIIMLPGT